MHRRRFAAALSAALLAAPVSAVAAPLTLTDVLGRTVRLAEPAKRAIVGFYFEELTAAAGPEVWDRVVGISRLHWEGWRAASWQRYTAAIPRIASLPDIGSTENNTFAVEKVLSLQPDLVILPIWAFEPLGTALAPLEAAGIPVVVVDYNAQKLENHLTSTRLLGTVFGQKGRARELAAEYETVYRDAVARARSHSGAKPKVYVELAQAGPGTIGNSYKGTMWGAILDQLGAENLANGRLASPWGPLDAEAVIAADPDVVIFAGSSWANRPEAVRTGFDADLATTRAGLRRYVEGRAAWASVKAFREGRVHAIEHGLCRALADMAAIQYLGKALYPQAFADVDPTATLARYYERWLPVRFEGTWFTGLGS